MEKILLVDDVKLLLELQKRFLASSPVQILTACDGLEALEVARKEQPQLIVMDKYMPNMDGLTCCREIKADPLLRHIPVIMVSNAPQSVEIEEFRSIGIDAYLAKPIEGKLFLNTIRKYLPSVERRGSRLPCRLPVQLTASGSILDCMSEDISFGGMFVATARPFSRGDELFLSFVLPGCEAPIDVRGVVAWVNSRDVKSSLPPGVGVEFLEITGSGMPLLRSSELKSFVASAPYPASN